MIDRSNLLKTKCALIEAAATDGRLSELDVRIAVVLFSHLNRQPGPNFGKMWPATARIAEGAHASRRSVHRTLERLIELGYLRPVERGGGRRSDGAARTNIFEMGTVTGEATLPEGAQLTVPAETVNCDSGDVLTVPHVADKPLEENLSEEPVVESGDAAKVSRYRWSGKIVRLTEKHYSDWQAAYPRIESFDAELQLADDYYSENPLPDGKWFFPVSKWLKRANDSAGRGEGRQSARDVAAETDALYRSWGVQ